MTVQIATSALDPPPAFRGFRSPNYTPVPDEVFDELLTELSGAELKVLLYVIRRTFGFKRDSDTISLSQMLHGIQTRDGRTLHRGVGLCKPTLLQALRSLQAKGIVSAERQRSAERGDEPTVYALKFAERAAPATGATAPHSDAWPPPLTWVEAQEHDAAVARQREEDARRVAEDEAHRREWEQKPPEERIAGRLQFWLLGQRRKGREPDGAEVAAMRTRLIAELTEQGERRPLNEPSVRATKMCAMGPHAPASGRVD